MRPPRHAEPSAPIKSALPRWIASVSGPIGVALVAVIVLTVMSLKDRASWTTAHTEPVSRHMQTIAVHLSVGQFREPPTWHDIVAYYGLEEPLVEATKLANAGPNGTCPSEPITLPQDIVIALTPLTGKACQQANR